MEENKPKLTPLSSFGEFGLINHLTNDIELKNPSTIKGIGDDAAVLDFNSKQIVVTTDLLIEGVHFDLSYCPLKHLGYKSVVVNLSDIFAMNAEPRQITVSIAVSNRFSVEALEEFYQGIKLACNAYKVDLVGGDTSTSTKGMVICITAIGEISKEDVVYRNSARENDLICVSGDLGASYMGLQLLEREKQVFKGNPNVQPELKDYDYILGRQLKPEARADIIRLFKILQIKPNAMIDISDGLSSELIHICSQSGVGCKIYEDKLPIHEQTIQMAKEFNLDPTVTAMNGGEDYELLFTLPLKDYDLIRPHKEISIVGQIVGKDKGLNLVTRGGDFIPIQAQGWKAF